VSQSLKWKARASLERLGLWRWAERARLFERLLLRRTHEADFEYFKRFDGREGLFVDVGANIGQSAISFRIFNRSFKILSFEPNALVEPELKFVGRLLGSRFSYRMEGLGSKTETRKFYYPVVDGVPLTQEGSLSERFAEDPTFPHRLRQATGQERYEIASSDLKFVRFDELGLKPDVIKLDVQGHELQALEGMKETLASAKPILMVEHGPGIVEVGRFLGEISYVGPLYYLNGNLVEAAQPGLYNVFFTTPERR
jgi:FkbM family methyltransferase